MRTTWIIIVLMLLTGAVMYFLSKRKLPAGPYDSIRLSDTGNQASAKTKVYIAYNATEVMYNDTVGWTSDSVPLKEILHGSQKNYFNKQYRSAALFVTYDNRYFFDFEVNKPDTSAAYDISLQITPVHDSLYVEGRINTNQDSVLRFSGPMFHLYPEFAVIYNYKLPPDPDDTVHAPDDAPRPTKTISIFRK